MENIQDKVEFDRVTDKPLDGHIVGAFNSTQKDEHGHIVPSNVYPKAIKSMEQHPERRIVSINHNRDEPIGEILWAGIQEKDDTTLLVGEVGIYEEIDQDINEIGNLGGFSVTLVGYENIDEESWNPSMANFRYRGFGEDYHRLNETVSRKEIPARLEVQKSASGAFLFDAVVENIPLLLELALVAYSINRERKKSKEEQDSDPEIVINQTNIELNKDIDVFLDDLSEVIGEDVWLDPDQAEELVEAINDEDAKIEFEANPEYE